MTTKRLDDGGNAFPYSALNPDNSYSVYKDNEGMTLLDYFAGQALAGELSAQTEAGWYDHDSNVADANKLAERCYTFAQAMLAHKRKLQEASDQG